VLIALLLYVTLRPLLTSPQVWAAGILTTGRRIAQRIKPVKIRNIGVGLEHSDGDGEIVSAAVSLANLYKAKLTLLHVVETPGAIVLPETGDLHTREDYAYVEELAREIEREDLPVETWLHAGNPADQITRAIQELGLDMLVLGSHGHKGVQDLVFGQTVNSLRHAISIPVLIVRIPDFAVEKPQKTE
jgi:manganese transport protein